VFLRRKAVLEKADADASVRATQVGATNPVARAPSDHVAIPGRAQSRMHHVQEL